MRVESLGDVCRLAETCVDVRRRAETCGDVRRRAETCGIEYRIVHLFTLGRIKYIDPCIIKKIK